VVWPVAVDIPKWAKTEAAHGCSRRRFFFGGNHMLSALTQLLVFQLVGEVVARGLSLPVPGPVLGMLFRAGA
jgi:hypothetical protein